MAVRLTAAKAKALLGASAVDGARRRKSKPAPPAMSFGFRIGSGLHGEAVRLLVAHQLHSGMVTEHRFSAARQWAFDCAWPAERVALEIDGGTRGGGRHVRHDGYAEDCRKLGEAAVTGWIVLRVTKELMDEGLMVSLVGRALAARRGGAG